MPRNKGIIHLLPLFFLAAVAVGVYLVVRSGGLQNILPQKEPEVSLQTEYKNPLTKESQYVNPFSQYKNPFDALR